MRLRRPRLLSFRPGDAALPRGLSRPGTAGRVSAKVVIPVTVVALLAVGIPLGLIATRPDIRVRGLPKDAMVGKSELADLSVRITTADPGGDDLRVRLDGKPVRAARKQSKQGALLVDLRRLSDGRHTLTVSAGGGLGLVPARATRAFTVDTRAPRLDVPDRKWASSFTEPVTLTGSAAGAARLSAGGEQIRLRGGKFRLRVERPPATVKLAASDEAGNTTRKTVTVAVKHPGMRAVHMTASAWASDALRKPVMDMIRAGKINTVELDIKDESGQIGYDSNVPLAEKIGADKGYYNAKKVIDKLHSMGVRVVGRLVCFNDPLLAEAAWKSGHRKRVIQTPGGGAYSGGYGEYSFTNFANPVVRQYNIDVAVEAARLGFDDILFDYIRRPDGYLEDMVFPGLEVSPTRSITSFLAEATKQIHQAGAFVGVSVFGITVTRPKSTAQNIPQMAEHADYISPMVYPSHWGPGEYGVAHPNRQPYEIVKRSVRDFQQAVEGTGAVVIPWLQDFSLGVSYGPQKVHAQIEALHDLGIESFLLWNAGAQYTAAALRSPGRPSRE